MSLIGAIVAVVVGGVIALVKYTELGDKFFNQSYTFYMDYGSIPILVLFTIVGAAVVSTSCKRSIQTLETMEIAPLSRLKKSLVAMIDFIQSYRPKHRVILLVS
ncbi:hypothetical protein SAMN05444162_0625 [Paenibacillaceae bacterium GAS479]|nr:hypothetical protein SAMN05444162_0625 [Paenibacillaceae bacterium GAS479]